MELTPYMVTFGLFMLGILCIVVEVFVIPGFGLVGVLGGLILLGDVVYASLTIGPVGGIVVLVAALIASGAAIYLVMFTRVGRRFRLAGDLKDSRSAVSVGRERLLGAVGVADSHLRPAGVVIVGEERVDATTAGEFIEKGTRVRIVAVQGPGIVVEAAPDGQ